MNFFYFLCLDSKFIRMFYILFHHSTIIKKNKLFYNLLYGSLLYLAIHIIMMFSDIESLRIFKDNYFWTILSIDLSTFIYLFISGSTLSTNGIVEGNNNIELNDILKPFKDEINKVLNQNNEIKMTKQDPVISFPSNNEKIVMESDINSNQKVNNNNNDQNVNINNNIVSDNNNTNINSVSSGNYSTPIKRLNKNNNNQPVLNNNQSVVNNNQVNSTNVMDLRNRLASQAQDMKPEGFTRIDSQNNNSNQNMNNYNQNISTSIKKDTNYRSDTLSVADSDIGSALDLDLNDFENSIN